VRDSEEHIVSKGFEKMFQKRIKKVLDKLRKNMI